MDFDRLLKCAERFEKNAQVVSPQPGDIEKVLSAAGLFDLIDEVGKLADTAGAPDGAKIQINILVNPGPKVSFSITLDPANAKVIATLNKLLLQQYSAKMSTALKNAKMNVADMVVVKWLNLK